MIGPVQRERGATREVLLLGPWAFKVPVVSYGWRPFLHGLLANMQERMFSAARFPRCCPVLWADPLGLLVIMARARPLERELTDAEWEAFDRDNVPSERKASSYGWYAGELVALDYG